MRYKTIFTFLILILFAASAGAQNGYQSAKETVKVGGKRIVVKTNVYLNLMPQIIDDNPIKPDCSKSGSLIAPATVETANNSKLPTGIEIRQVWIKSNGVWRQIQFHKDETNKKENSIRSVARACPNNDIKQEKEIIVAIELKYKGKSYFVRSSQTKIQTAF
jgi:hypothetical protein